MKSREEKNRYIHEKVMEKCVHDWQAKEKVFYKEGCPDVFDYNYRCRKCGTEERNGGNYSGLKDYCSDSSPRELLNGAVAKVVAQCGLDEYAANLGSIIAAKELLNTDTSKWSQELFVSTIRVLCLEATAEQIVDAIIAATSDGEEG